MFAAGKTNAVSGVTYVDDVFSTYLYTGNGSTQTITNGIDLAGKGGLVWFKNRTSATNNLLLDTARGSSNLLISNLTNGQSSYTGLNTFNSNGFSLNVDPGSSINASNNSYVSWSFRKAPKFFDVVTYTGNGTNRTIAHSLGQVPGCIIVKRTDAAADWQVYHRSLSNTEYLVLNTTAAKATGTTRWNSTTPTATEFSLGTDTTVNANTGTYVAYLFSHDTATDGLIQCGSFTTDGSGNATVTLGWEPQFVIVKRRDNSVNGNWYMEDVARGMPVSSNAADLYANTSVAEASGGGVVPNATGFTLATVSAPWVPSNTYIYLAIRRPNKPPTSGTQVFQPTVYTGTNVDNRLVNTTIAPDMVWVRQRDDTVLGGMVVGDRLRGQPYLLTGSTAAEVNTADAFDAQLISAVEYGNAFSSMNGFWCGNDPTAKLNINTTSNNHIAEAFKRAPGVFDVAIYTGNGAVGQQWPHNLGVKPELIIQKARSTTGNWVVAALALETVGSPNGLLNTNGDLTSTTYGLSCKYSTTTTFYTDFNTGNTNVSGTNYVAYLFASAVGISKVGSYTGNGGTAGTNGTSQTINCGFGAGARFVLIKRTDSTGNWYVFDSARGIVAASDPYLLTNSTAAEVTSVDAVDADNSGFIVNQTSGTDLNVTSATYIYLAYA